MSLDAGAREIHRLLTAPNASLRSALQRQMVAIQHGLESSGAAAPRLKIPSAAIDATNDLRLVAEQLYRRIAAIHTKRRDTKRRVLDALDLFDFSLSLFVKGLEAPSDAKLAELARESYWQHTYALTELGRAVEELR